MQFTGVATTNRLVLPGVILSTFPRGIRSAISQDPCWMGLLTLLRPAASAVWLPGSGRHWTRPRTVGPRAEDTAVSGVAHRAARRPARWPTDGNARVYPATTETRMLPEGHLAVGYLARSPSGVGPMTPGGPRRRRARRRHAGSGSDGRTPGRPGEPAPVRTGPRRLAAVRGRLRRRPVVFRPSFRPGVASALPSG